MADETQEVKTEPELANTMKFAKRVHRNKYTFLKTQRIKDSQGQVKKVKTRVKKDSYISLREFIRKNERLFINPQGKLADILCG